MIGLSKKPIAAIVAVVFSEAAYMRQKILDIDNDAKWNVSNTAKFVHVSKHKCKILKLLPLSKKRFAPMF